MLVLPGSSVLSATRRDILLSNLQRANPSVQSVDVVWIHLVSPTSVQAESGLSNPTSPIRPVLDRLLAYGDNLQLPGTVESLQNPSGNVIYVVPRPGSVSPWSSKATDIAALCNLKTHIERLERGIAYVVTLKDSKPLSSSDITSFGPCIHDRMTQIAQLSLPAEADIFRHRSPAPLVHVSLDSSPKDRLSQANQELGLALAPDEIDYLVAAYGGMSRDPTDAELFMFAQVNSEHCRHKIFNASWTLDSKPQPSSLFSMIRNTEKLNPKGTISAYSDNAAVFEGHVAPRLTTTITEGGLKLYGTADEEMPILIKVETHNHPTAVSPYPGAATGSGGEIRDEGAVGRGSHPKAGLAGFSVSNLMIPGYEQPWEEDFGKPGHIASALDIMRDAPLGGSAFNNEFGRPALGGYFRTFCERVGKAEGGEGGEVRGYHKPIMIAGGLGNVRPQFAHKDKITPGAKIIVLGGPGMLIGLGGGAASSRALGGAGSAELDFTSVQRDNAEMQRRAQMVIDACVDLGPLNPIQSIHDVGAGGLSNALPELVHDSGLGARFEIRDVPVADGELSPMEIWCNESQERYVLAVGPGEGGEDVFRAIAERERALFGVVGEATEVEGLVVTDRLLGQDVINLKMSTLFGKPPRMVRNDVTRKLKTVPFDTSLSKYIPSSPTGGLTAIVEEAARRVFSLPSVASKSFLITIGDRSITGLVTRDQMVGAYQTPVSDVAVTRSSYSFTLPFGEAMSMGERTPLALLSPAASARIAVCESLTNLAAAYIGGGELERVKLSANWMCAAGVQGEGVGLYEAVRAVGEELCPALGIGIPVGKDSMSMSMRWRDEKDGSDRDVTAPLSLIVTAFARVADVRKTWTPELRTDEEVGEETVLVFFDLAGGKTRLGGSALAQVFREIGEEAPDVEDAKVVRAFFEGTQRVRETNPDSVLAYHDRSDGGLFTTLAEMAFAGRVGLRINLDALGVSGKDPVAALFTEELGAVVQVAKSNVQYLLAAFSREGFPSTSVHVVGSVNPSSDQSIDIIHGGTTIFSFTRSALQETWASTSYKMQSLRDDPACATEEFNLISSSSPTLPKVSYDLTFKYDPLLSKPLTRRPKVAILREQGVNGHQEMAWAFHAAGFDAIDVHMSDMFPSATSSREPLSLQGFAGLAACGGFSYGDVLGAGKGWANSVLLHEGARKEFKDFFERKDTFALGVCNGCQFFSGLTELIGNGAGEDSEPEAQGAGWPEYKENRSGRFEARVTMVQITDNAVTRSSPFLHDMIGSRIPVAVAHGEGRAVYSGGEPSLRRAESQGLLALQYVDGEGNVTQTYPLNPNGSMGAVAGVQTRDGRVLALMPHPERVVALASNSWAPKGMEEQWEGTGPWFRLFQNARRWCN